MKVHLLRSPGAVYSCNSYLVLGDWNRLEDVNALVDVGTDGSVIGSIASIWTGVGKKAVERVVLTHSHFDHAGGLLKIRRAFNPEVCAHTMIEGVGRRLTVGEVVRLGDEEFEVIYVPEHSSDSVCLFSSRSGVLFSGDTPLMIGPPGRTCDEDFVMFLESLVHRGVATIYSGHDRPVLGNARLVIEESLQNVNIRNVA